jgi:hypothetical protein
MTSSLKISAWLRSPQNLVSGCALACWIAYAGTYLSRTLSRLWFFSSDEYVIAAEVIRFCHWDFRQHFFDSPGTFFMLLGSPLWALYYGVERALGLAPTGGIGTFTFQHLPGLFGLLRALTVVCFLLSVLLCFVLVAKLINSSAAALSSLLLALSPVYTGYSSFIRTESLAMVCILGAILLVLGQKAQSSAADPPRLSDRTILAGVLVGLAAGARLHSATAALPVLLMLLWMQGPAAKAYPPWVVKWSKVIVPLSWAAAVAVILRAMSWSPESPAAQRLVIAAAAGWLAVSAGTLILYLAPRTRRLAVRAASTGVIKLLAGCAVGGLLGNPTVLWQYSFFFGSVQMYSQYRDLDRAQWPFWTDLAWYVRHYVNTLAPDVVTLVLLFAGAAAILLMRHRKMLPFLIAAGLFFVSKPLTLVAAPHHVILWLPFFFLVCAYPVGRLLDLLAGRVPHGNVWAALVLAIMLYAAFGQLTPGPRLAAANASATEARLRNIESATKWLKRNAEPGGTVAISYFCFNPDTFYAWARQLEVPVPDAMFDGRKYLIWWGYQTALQGRAGYACATRSDVDSLKRQRDLELPGSGTDPYTDGRFRMTASFGSGQDEVDLFRFDYRQQPLPLQR